MVFSDPNPSLKSGTLALFWLCLFSQGKESVIWAPETMKFPVQWPSAHVLGPSSWGWSELPIWAPLILRGDQEVAVCRERGQSSLMQAGASAPKHTLPPPPQKNKT